MHEFDGIMYYQFAVVLKNLQHFIKWKCCFEFSFILISLSIGNQFTLTPYGIHEIIRYWISKYCRLYYYLHTMLFRILELIVGRYRFCLLLWFYVFPNSPKQYEIQVLLCTQHHFYIDSTPFSVSTLLPFKSFAVFHLTQ